MSNTVYEIITARILSELEKGVIPWQQPWTSQLAPQNFISKKPYKGINALVLSIASQQYGCPYFATIKQISRLGGRVRSTEWKQNSLVCLWKWILVEDKETGEKRPVGYLRYTRVWNLTQTEGIEWSLPERRQNDPIEECERIVQSYQDQGGPTVHREETSHAYYNLIEDSVHVPTPDRFVDSYSFYQVLFHELSHSTGHASRLNRNLTADRDTRAYAREELTAEISAAFLLGSAGLTEEIPVTNSVAYLQTWRQALRGDARCVVCAASRAQRAADWILGIRDHSDTHEQAIEKEACHEMV